MNKYHETYTIKSTSPTISCSMQFINGWGSKAATRIFSAEYCVGTCPSLLIIPRWGQWIPWLAKISIDGWLLIYCAWLHAYISRMRNPPRAIVHKWPVNMRKPLSKVERRNVDIPLPDATNPVELVYFLKMKHWKLGGETTPARQQNMTGNNFTSSRLQDDRVRWSTTPPPPTQHIRTRGNFETLLESIEKGQK